MYFSYLEPGCCSMSTSNCCFLTCIQISQEAGQVVWYSHLFQNFPQFVVIHTVKGFGIVNEAEVDIFLELASFFNDLSNVGSLISGSSAFSKSRLNIWNFTVPVLLKPGLENQIPYDYTVEVRNRFRGLGLIDIVPEELWMEVHDIVQKAGIKTVPKKKKCKKAKWLSEGALPIAVKRREAKSKGEKERYTNLNAEFQRIARRDKKAFLSDQYKEIEESNRVGKTRDLFKKIRDTKGIFHAQFSSVQSLSRVRLFVTP